MHIRDFELGPLRRAEKRSIWLDIAESADGRNWRLPLLTVIGANAGPTLLVLAGVHGDEYEGIAAIPQVHRLINPLDLRGRLVMAPICNIPHTKPHSAAVQSMATTWPAYFPAMLLERSRDRSPAGLTRKLLPHADF